MTAQRKAQRAARAALDRKALDLVVLDVQGLSGVTDYFLVCSGRSTTHLKSITDAIREELKEDGVRPLHTEGTTESATELKSTQSLRSTDVKAQAGRCSENAQLALNATLIERVRDWDDQVGHGINATASGTSC